MDIIPAKQSVRQGYNIDLKNPVTGFTKLHRASWLGYPDEVRNCLKTIPTNTKDADMRTPLHLAAAAGHTLIVRILMENDLNFNDTDCYGKTAIMKAIECSHKETVKLMIAKGIDLTAADRNGNNAMHMAIIGGHYDIASLMLHYFPNCNVGNIDGITPFHMLTEGIQVKLARKFIDYGACINTLDKRGRSPLMLACKRGCFPMVALLLKHGSNPQLKDNDGWGPLDYASIMGHTQIKNLLEKYISGEVSFDTEKEAESSSSDEDENNEIQSFLDRSSQRIVPIRIESQSMFLKRQKRLSMRKENEAKEAERRMEGVRNADGTLLPMPDVVAAMQMQANKLGSIHEWLLKHEELIENKRKDYEQLKEQAKKLWEQRKKLMEKQEEQKKKAAELSVRRKNVVNKREAECLEEQVDILRDGLADLREEHDRAVAERDELQRTLEEGYEVNKNASTSMEQKAVQLLKENEMLYEKLNEIQNQTRDVTNDLTDKCKTADTLMNHLKTILRGTYRLLEEKHSEVNKVMKEVDDQQDVINNTKGRFDKIRGENANVEKAIVEVDSKMKLVRKYLEKIHKEMEKHPLTKSLIDAGVLDKKEEIRKSSSESTLPETKMKLKKDRRHELEPEPEVSMLADQNFDLTRLMSSTSNAPTVCQSILENVRYSWLGDEADSSEIGENDLQVFLDKRLPGAKSVDLTNTIDTDDNAVPSHLEAKRNSVAAKYSR